MSLAADAAATATGATPTRRPSPGLLIATLGTVGVVVSLMQTLVIPIIPVLPSLLDTSAANASWVITATLLAGAVFTPISGRLGDMYGKRRVLLINLLFLITGSVICASFSALAPAVAGRALQGAAVGAIPLGISIMRDELPPERVGSAMAIMSATLGVGGAIGLPVAALIAQNADWHVLFWAAAGMGVLCAALVFAFVPESPVRTPARFDFFGAIGLSIALLALLVGITKGVDWGWSSASILTLFTVSVVVFLGWGYYELRRAAPLVDLRVSARPRVLFTNLASIAVGFSLYGMSLTFPQLLMAPEETGYGFGLSMVQAGLALAPGGVVMMLLSPVSARLSAARGPKVTLMLGAAVIGVGYLCAVLLMNSVWEIVLAGVIVAGGVGLAFAAMPALIMGAVPITETAAANGLNSLMRSIGTSTSAAVMSVVLAHMTVSLGAHVLPSRDGFHTTFYIAVAASIVAIVLTACIPMGKKDT
ncbi:MFS transporter [Nocardia puris]|uniref:MFS transporter n=1 Tax=Nocardia puris TaxID=208602 RepID=A0A366DTV1_9NOCA|nr:MFS transporter [Nocardia puris]MBF6364417.1 MFS transporter [Nocardia puris]MBF6459346.1 MFS transporter [Nocardia puris]RBO92694.1 MFS transporter [Nocardia puris]